MQVVLHKGWSENGAARLSLADALEALGRLDESVRSLRAALDLQPGNPTTLERLGDSEAARGRVEAARESYDGAAGAYKARTDRKRAAKKARDLRHSGVPDD